MKRPTIRRSAPREKRLESFAEQLIPQRAVSEPVRAPEPPKPTFKIFNLTPLLFNAVCTYNNFTHDIGDIFVKLNTERPPEILVASLRGGRFKELARINEKGTVLGREEIKTVPNQLSLTFEKGFANVFVNGVIRFTGVDEDRILKILTKYFGKLRDVEYSLKSGQMQVDKSLDIKRMEQYIPSDTKLTSSSLTVQIFEQRRIEKAPPKKLGILESFVRKREYEYVKTKLYTLSFFKSGVVQYKGSGVDDVVNMVKQILESMPPEVFGEYKNREKKTKTKREYKTRSANPPNPPNSFEGKCQEGYYCRPNAQGAPTCYLIPKINDSSRRTVIESYKRIGVDIPEGVRRIFNIERSTQGLSNMSIELTKTGILKIGGRQCSRLTEDQIEDVARRLHIPGVIKGMGLAKMCKVMTAFAKKHQEFPNFTVKGVKYYIEGDKIRGALRSNGKPNPPRRCETIPAETLYTYARALGIDPKGKTKAQICSMMQKTKEKKKIVNEELAEITEYKLLLGDLPYRESEFEEWVKLDPSKQKVFIARLKLPLIFKKQLENIPYNEEDYQEWLKATPLKKREVIERLKRQKKNQNIINRLNYGNLENVSKNALRKGILDYSHKGNPSDSDVDRRAEVLKKVLKKLEYKKLEARGEREFM